jgi:hypothetical protein
MNDWNRDSGAAATCCLERYILRNASIRRLFQRLVLSGRLLQNRGFSLASSLQFLGTYLWFC